MTQDVPRYTNIQIRVQPSSTTAPAPSNAEVRGYQASDTVMAPQTYDALVYARNLPMTMQPAAEPSPWHAREWMGWPLVSVQRLTVEPERYQSYLARYLEKQNTPALMARHLEQMMSPGLRELLTSGFHGPCRIWWDSETPELADLPWEFVVYAGRDPRSVSFVRGHPPTQQQPFLPLFGQLRVGVLAGPSLAAGPLTNLRPTARVKFVPLLGRPVEALRRVVAEGIEVLHIIADGYVSEGLEGMLYLHGAEPPMLAPSMLSSALQGSRVKMIGLEYGAGRNPDLLPLGGYDVPSAYRAFAYLGRSAHPLPTTIAPLGPTDPEDGISFWRSFYTALASTLDIEQAMTRARKQVPWSSHSVCMRNSHGVLFVRPDDREEAADEPAELELERRLSQQLLDGLRGLESQVGTLPGELNSALTERTARQSQISDKLQRWLGPEALE
jgi:hypothetical protein